VRGSWAFLGALRAAGRGLYGHCRLNGHQWLDQSRGDAEHVDAGEADTFDIGCADPADVRIARLIGRAADADRGLALRQGALAL